MSYIPPIFFLFLILFLLTGRSLRLQNLSMTQDVIHEEKIPSFKQHQKAFHNKEPVSDMFRQNLDRKAKNPPTKAQLLKPSGKRLTSSQSAYDIRPMERYASFLFLVLFK